MMMAQLVITTGSDLQTYMACRDALLEAVRTVLIKDLRVQLPPEYIDPDTALFGTGLALDSIDAVDFVIGIEQRTGVRISDDAAGRLTLRTINLVVTHLLMAQDAGPRGEAP